MQLADRLYSSTEVAEILGVSLRSVYRYLEDNKLQADVKTATGRHRFTKQNILDFLYPNGQVAQQQVTPPTASSTEASLAEPAAQPIAVQTSVSDTVVDETSPQGDTNLQTEEELQLDQNAEPVVETTPTQEDVSTEGVAEDAEVTNESADSSIENSGIEDNSEEPSQEDEDAVDWLAKFREAAKKYREEAEAEDTAQVPQPVEQTATQQTPAEHEQSESAVGESYATASHTEAPKQEPVAAVFESSDTADTAGVEPEVAELEPEVSQTHYYYRSGLGGLKDIAQGVDKSAKRAGVDYAFTLNAGMSLIKPIKPFSLLHAYIRPQDKELFEKTLQLTSASEDKAQLCLILSDEARIFDTAVEMHGLTAVSKLQLKKDLEEAGEFELADEVE